MLRRVRPKVEIPHQDHVLRRDRGAYRLLLHDRPAVSQMGDVHVVGCAADLDARLNRRRLFAYAVHVECARRLDRVL